MNEINLWLVGGGFAVGAVFAVVLQRFRFCMVAGVSNLILMRDYRQAEAFAVALLVAIVGTGVMEIMEIVAIADSSYRNSTLDWLGAGAGGFLFGAGATLAGGCVARTLVRSTEGSVHSILALLMFALVAAITQFGFLEPARLWLTTNTAIVLSTDAGLATVLSLSPWLVLAVVAAGLLLFIYRGWQRSPDLTMIIVGIVVGSLVVFSWYDTGVLAQDEFNPAKPSGMTMSGPLARFGYIIISGSIPTLSFSISFILGAALVSFLLALFTHQFRLTAPKPGMTKWALLGGGLMGVGSIMAYGCNIGQGLTGISTLSLESIIAVAGIVIGIGVVTRWMETRA
jgi:uncharacterized membrane protein YedE/YeeE